MIFKLKILKYDHFPYSTVKETAHSEKEFKEML